MKFHLVLISQAIVSPITSVAKILDRQLILEYQEFDLQRRTATTRAANSAKTQLKPWPSFHYSAGERGASQTYNFSPGRSRSPGGSLSSDPAFSWIIGVPSRKRDRSPSPGPSQIGHFIPNRDRSPSLKPPRSRSSSNSRGSWSGHGFTSSSSPSSWGSERYHSDVDSVTANAIAKGPAVIRSRAGADSYRTYKDIQKGRTAQTHIRDRNKVQTAIYARRGGQGMVSASHALNLGESSKIIVDSRKSKLGGWIQFTNENGEVNQKTVPPGRKDVRLTGYKVKGFVHGPGKAKVTTKNEGWGDSDTTSSDYSS